MTKKQSVKHKKLYGLLPVALLCSAIVMQTGWTTSMASADDAAATTSSEGKRILADYESYEETLRAGEELNEELEGEGAVLLKNKDNALPLKAREKHVTMFGIGSSNLVTGGGGSGGGTLTEKMNSYDLYDSMEAAGFKVNQAVRGFYDSQKYSDGSEVDPAKLADYEDSYATYGDAAIITISRTGAEMSDRPRSGVDGDKDKHYLELNANEEKLIDYVTARFDKVIVLINSSNVMELGKLEDNEKIDSILWIGHPGTTGAMAIGRLLNGEINPSGHLVDVWMADMKYDPTWFNSGDQSHIEGGSAALIAEGTNVAYDPANEQYATYNTLMYKEGIYMGYRWYETADVEGLNDNATAVEAPGNTGVKDDKYYNRTTGVVYPFGFGMSYTSFEWTNYSVTVSNLTERVIDGDYTTANEPKVTVKVTVTNTGSVAGKDVVQIYSHSPYVNGEVEKAEVDLVDFAKTDLLEPGESQELTIEFALRDMAQFDYDDANGNNYSTYEIDAAEGYTISARSDSHNVKNNCSVDITDQLNFDGTENSQDIIFTHDATSGTEIDNMFSKGDEYDSLLNKTEEDYGMVTREDGKFALPTASTAAERTVAKSYLQKMDDDEMYEPYEDSETDDYYRKSVPESWTQVAQADRKENLNALSLVGLDYVEPVYDAATGKWTESQDADTKAWETFLNSMSYEELVTLVSNGQAGVPAMESIGLPEAEYNDGPGQLKGGGNGNLTGDYGTFYVSHVVIASTWNVDLAEKQGQIIGNESLFLGTDGWWGPGANTHRSPFGGRNFEYYSQDGVQGGMIASAVMQGVTKKGVQVFIKHYAINEQELLRSEPCSISIISEQAARQIYLKTFEYAFKGGCNGAMTATTRIGVVPNANNYRLLNSLTREEWGANAIFMEDVEAENWHNIDQNLRAGNSLPLTDRTGAVSGTWDATNKCVTVDKSATDKTQVASPTQWYAVRSNAQRVIEHVINSNAIENGVDLSAFKDSALQITQGMNASGSVAAKVDGVDIVSYKVVEGELPEGVTLTESGSLSGIAQKSGTYTFTVEIAADFWITKTAEFTLNVVDSITTEGDMSNVIVGVDNSFQLETPVDLTTYDEATFAITEGALPEGMDINSAGLIYGTPAATGTYTFNVRITATKTENAGTTSASQTVNTFNREFTMTVVEPADQTFTVTFNVNYEGGTNSTQSVTEGAAPTIPETPAREGYTFTGWYLDKECTIVASFQAPITANVTYYAGWEAVAEAGGCGAAMSDNGMVAAMALLTLAAAGTVVAKMYLRSKNK